MQYFSVGGGPFGFEEALSAASAPSLCLWALGMLAVLWALPQALYIAELSTRYERGFNDWLTVAMGSTIGFAHSLLRLAFGALTNAVYAGLFSHYFVKTISPAAYSSDYNRDVTTEFRLHWQKAAGLGLFETIVVLVNLRGARLVGNASIVLLLFVLLPFVVLIGWSVPRLDWAMFTRLPAPETGWSWHNINFSLLVSVLMFNLMGWDFVGNLSSRSRKPSRDVPLGICGALVLVVLTYMLPTFASASILGEAAALHSTNLYVDAASALWHPFGYIISGAALFGVLGLGCAFMSTSSEGIAHGVHYGFMFPILEKRLKGGAPLVGVLAQALIAFCVCLAFDFSQLVQIQMGLFCISTLLIALCFIILRWRDRSLPASSFGTGFRLRVGFVPSLFIALFPLLLSVFGLCVSEWPYAVASASTVIVCLVTAIIWTRLRSSRGEQFRNERFLDRRSCISVPSSQGLLVGDDSPVITADQLLRNKASIIMDEDEDDVGNEEAVPTQEQPSIDETTITTSIEHPKPTQSQVTIESEEHHSAP